MRIAQVSPLYESVPPKYYGGTERVVFYLTEELIKMGHEVTLFASGDSITSARLMPPCRRSLRLSPGCVDKFAYHVLEMEYVLQLSSHFDIIHFHNDYLHFPMSRRLNVPTITTLHGRLDIPDLEPIYHEFREIPLVSISHSQRSPLPWVNWQATIYHGLPQQPFTPHNQPGKYLAFLGRISIEKRPDRAIDIATRVGMPLKVAAKTEDVDREYFNKAIKPRLKNPLVEFIGEIGSAAKNDFLGNAYCLLFPIDWPEPFGLVLIEAMACGTPVIAFRCGSVPEIVEDGVTGFIVNDVEEAIRAIKRIPQIDRRRCRSVFERRFTSSRMAKNYLQVYQGLLRGQVEVWHGI